MAAVATHHCLLANYVVLFWIEIKDFSVKNLKWWQIATAVTFVVQAVTVAICQKICVILSLERFVLEKNSFNGKTEYPYNIYRRNNRHD